MSDHEIINSWELVQTERERWADKLAPKYCERTKQHCNTPWTCSSQCRVIDSQLPIQMFEPPRWYHQPPSLYFFAVVGALIGFAVAVYQTF